MPNVQLPVSKIFYSHILMHSRTQKNDVSGAKEFQKHLSKEHWKQGVIDKVKYRKRSSERKWKDREYPDQDNSGVAQKEVKYIVIQTNS